MELKKQKIVNEYSDIINFRKLFDHNKLELFKFSDQKHFGVNNISTNCRWWGKSQKMTFSTLLIINTPNDVCIDYINPLEWHDEIKSRIKEFILANLDMNNYSFEISLNDKYHTQNFTNKDYYLIKMNIDFSITKLGEKD